MKKEKNSKVKWIVLLLTGMLLLMATGCASDVTVVMNSSDISEGQTAETPEDSEASEAEDILSAPVNFDWTADESGQPDAAGVRVTWNPVPKVDGYEYRFYLFWGDNSEVQDQGDTAETHASVFFQDNGNIKVEVRAYQIVDGEKQYSAWSSDVLEESDVNDL